MRFSRAGGVMSRLLGFAALIALVSALSSAGCGCGARSSGQNAPRPCRVDGDCASAERCASDGFCHPDGQCLDNESACGQSCCGPTETCFEMTCLPCPN